MLVCARVDNFRMIFMLKFRKRVHCTHSYLSVTCKQLAAVWKKMFAQCFSQVMELTQINNAFSIHFR